MLESAISLILFFFIPLLAFAQEEEWKIEAEDGVGSAIWKKNTCDIDAPKGFTLWNKNMMEGNIRIEYEARIVADKKYKDKEGKVRISDLNCFVLADKCGGFGGKFVNNYALSMYYVGYGGNWNSTTRFRRYEGDSRGVDSAQYRPIILKEYTDAEHLLKGNHWYKIKIEMKDGRFRYYIDNELLVDYVDPKPLTKGYFGFRTTLSHAQLRNFKYECSSPDNEPIIIRSISGQKTSQKGIVTFGVPFAQGEKNDNDFTVRAINRENEHSSPIDQVPYSTWRLASWPDGSAKWQAFSVLVPKGCDSLSITKTRQSIHWNPQPMPEVPPFYVTVNGKIQPIVSKTYERDDYLRDIKKYSGKNFIIRTYENCLTTEVKLVHTLLVDSTLNKEGLNELSIHFKVPMHGEAYERYVQFEGNKSMSVQPLIARRPINLETNDAITQNMIKNIAKWDGFRLSQLSPNGYSVRKRATSVSPWIGTIEGHRHNGQVAIGDSTSCMSFRLKDFWESYPSTLQVDNARSDTAIVTISLYSPEAEPYSFEHYDTIAHTLEAAYEDVQPGLSTAWGIGRTSTILIQNSQFIIHNGEEGEMEELRFCCIPEYLHRKRAFGIWSLPTIENERDSLIESTLDSIMSFYEKEIERNGWYGYFNYGDVMHAYDASRDEWRYDVGGFAWDNTELGTPAMLWYQFLRTGDPKVWRMAEAMTRHCSEVDTYHLGPHAGLGSRHNVTHWGCGAKEARISEAWWNRFYYYLTADDRIGDIMHEVVDTDTLLYTLDPMRLAQPREQYPCSAPARLRIGPDWLGYASNWFTEYERNGNKSYLDKTINGMTSIANLPYGFYQGPLALGYDPKTGIISTDMPEALSSNHLMSIMGGFELINEMEMSIPHPQFYATWLAHNKEYKENALKIRKNKFLIPRLSAYAGWRLGDDRLKKQAWDDLLNHIPLAPKPQIWTNDCATWSMDAIFLKEVISK